MRKLIVIAIILLTGMGVSFNNTKKVNEKWGDNGTANRIDTSMSEESKERLEKNQQEIEKIINDEKIAEGIVEETKVSEQDEKVKQEQKNETTQVQSNSNSNASKKQESNTKTNKKANSNTAKKSESTSKQEKPSESVAEVKQETPKQEKKTQQTTPKQEEKIYCVDGGKTHIAGDGANEHGYYKTWDEAFSAYEKYTEGWESSHFKINQCFCGLYYFSVTK